MKFIPFFKQERYICEVIPHISQGINTEVDPLSKTEHKKIRCNISISTDCKHAVRISHKAGGTAEIADRQAPDLY